MPDPAQQHASPKSDLEIAQAAHPRPIVEVAADKLGVPADSLEPYGRTKAKLALDYVRGLAERADAKLILVTAITPTPAGEGKTTTTVGLGDALDAMGKRAMICLREPSLGPCFGMKGGAAGGGYAQVVPMEDINLHFTGDFHAVGVANNLLAALIDNHIYWGNALALDQTRVTWRRVVDMNDRALRRIVCALGGSANGFPREDGFDITVASEVMAIFCLASDLDDLQRRLGNIVVGTTRENELIRAAELNAAGPMTALLKDALNPNLVQTLAGNPAFVHGGPFANIAHGCNSVVATKAALKLADYVVTEAGFGADLGAEKFFDIKCRKAGLRPDCVVLVATVRALKMHGGVARADLASENVAALKKGIGNLARHIDNVRMFGVPLVVAINKFSADTEAEMAALLDACAELEVEAVLADHWAAGAAGAADLARAVVRTIAERPSDFRTLYADDMGLWEKTRTIARTLYGASDIIANKRVRNQFSDLEQAGFGSFPVCIAKTQYSLSTDPDLKGAPSGHVVPIREVRLAGGAEFVVVICGDIMTMPGLPRKPAADSISVDSQGVRLAGGAEFVVVICGDIMTMPGLPRKPAADSISVDSQGRITGLF
jgi:formate--tetrahydrofolate ligase